MLPLWTHLTWLAVLAPPPTTPADLARFPARENVVLARQFNRAFQSLAEERWRAELWAPRAAAWGAALCEARELYRPWDALDDAQINAGDRAALLHHLGRLRALIGEEAWAAGQMPPAAPFWRFAAGR